MKGFYELYNCVTNPLLNDDVLNILLTHKNQNVNYFTILNLNSKDKEIEEKAELYEDRENLYIMLFDIWRFNILSLSKQQLMELKNRGSYDSKIYELFDLLSQHNERINTYEELMELFNRYPLIEKYCWHNYVRNNNPFVHVYSRELRAKQQRYIGIENKGEMFPQHRLYVNPNPNDMYRILGLFTKKAIERKIPFYYKFDDSAEKNRDDSIVFYGDDENIFDYIDILRTIGKNNSSVVHGCKKPPILTGYIDGWIGYASEPRIDLSGKYGSYNNMLSELLSNAVKELSHISTNVNENKSSYKIIKDIISKKAQEYGLDYQKICFNADIKEKILKEQEAER